MAEISMQGYGSKNGCFANNDDDDYDDYDWEFQNRNIQQQGKMITQEYRQVVVNGCFRNVFS